MDELSEANREAARGASGDTVLARHERTALAVIAGAAVVSAVFQGLVGALGFGLVHLLEPLFFVALTAFVSLVPGIGASMVWRPATVALILQGHVGAGSALAVWSTVTLTIMPAYVILRRFVSRDGNLPTLFSFVAFLGGTALFGLKSVLLGPLLMTMAIAVLCIYAAEERTRRHAPDTSPPASEHAGGPA